ncbi:MAG: S8 family serine peptidase [Firmicutes bacterium]|nr:S8 family serine peptidase [Bacillota bacterium]
MLKKTFFAFLFSLFAICNVYAEENYIVELKGGGLRTFSADGDMENIGSNMYVTDRETAEYLLKSGAAVQIEPDCPLELFDIDENAVESFAAEHNDQYYGSQIYMQKMDIPAMQAKFPCNIRIAVIDSGVNVTHPDLEGANILQGYNFVDNNTDISDTQNHGTRVVSVLAAVNDNEKGVAGIVPNAEILPLVAKTSTGGSVSTLIKALNAAVDDYGCKIINMSLGTTEYSYMLEKAVNSAANKGVVMICAAGNNGSSAEGTTPTYPAYLENTISVGAVTEDMQLTTYTRRSGNIDVAVPYVSSNLPNAYGGYSYGAGTSFTSPVITAVSAMLLAKYPDMDVNDIRDVFKAVSADVCDSGRDNSGFGVPMCGDMEKYFNDRYDIYISPFITGNNTLVKAFAKKDKDGLMLVKAVFSGSRLLRYETEDIIFDGDDMFCSATKLNDGESLKLFVWDSFEGQKNYSAAR